MSLDSAATFRERVIERGLEAHLAVFENLGWRTLGDLAFATSYSPRGGDEDVVVRELVMPALKDERHIGRPRLRRLFFEAFILSSAELRCATEATPTDVARVAPRPRGKRSAAVLNSASLF